MPYPHTDERLTHGEKTAQQWNARHPVGTPVRAYPCTRQCSEHALDTRTCSAAWTLSHGQPVVLIEGRAGGIALTHISPRMNPHQAHGRDHVAHVAVATVFLTFLLVAALIYAATLHTAHHQAPIPTTDHGTDADTSGQHERR